MHVSCLHTLAMNIPLFEAACPAGVTLAHHVRSDLHARAAGRPDLGVIAETTAHLRRLEAGSDAVLFTCTLLGAAAKPPVLAADALLAQEVHKRGQGKRVEVLHTCASVRGRLRELYADLSGIAGMRITEVTGGWTLLEAGDTDGHAAAVAEAVARSEADIVALAQAPMAGTTGDPRVLTVPQAALTRLQRHLRAA